MKKSCFLRFIIIFTIVLAVGLYLIQNKFNEFFFSPGKEIFLSVFDESWDDNFNYVKETPEKNSLKALLEYYLSNMESAENLSDERTKQIIEYLDTTFKDSLVDKEELSKIEKLIIEAL